MASGLGLQETGVGESPSMVRLLKSMWFGFGNTQWLNENKTCSKSLTYVMRLAIE